MKYPDMYKISDEEGELFDKAFNYDQVVIGCSKYISKYTKMGRRSNVRFLGHSI